MKKFCVIKWLFLLTIFCGNNAFSQKDYWGNDAEIRLRGAERITVSDEFSIPTFVQYRKEANVVFENVENYLKTAFAMDGKVNFQLLNTETDLLGFSHYRYQETFDGIPIHGAIYLVHTKDGKISSMNGKLIRNLSTNSKPSLSEKDALGKALAATGASKYKWEIPEEEAMLKNLFGNAATYFPKGELIFITENGSDKSKNYRLAYRFDIFAHEPLSRNFIFIDAETGELIVKFNRLKNTEFPATAHTKFSGERTITTSDTTINGTQMYRLRELSQRNVPIITLNLQRRTNFASAVDFLDSNNVWNNFNSNLDEIATDAHWATEVVYDYFLTKFGRNGIDGNNMPMVSLVHFYNNWPNAMWTGQFMVYGDGNAAYGLMPFTTLDIAGHEITHGVDEHTANLDYQNESGALNEGFSDIFGSCIEHFVKPSNTNWLIGEDIGQYFRSMKNPKMFQQPETYKGLYWDSIQQEVHHNSSVLSRWFYLLVEGGTGINDLGNEYNVQGIGWDTAAIIAYRTMSVYLTQTSNYHEARFFAIQAATDLFGVCSPQVASTINAFYAVGIGNKYSPEADAKFNVFQTNFCSAPATISFRNSSSNAVSYFWDFGDGTTSTEMNPKHTYLATGNFSVKLIATSNASCGISDTLLQENLISISPAHPCRVAMPESGEGNVQTGCEGTIFDKGSENPLEAQSFIPIDPPQADNITLIFTEFNLSLDDTLKIYDIIDSLNYTLIGEYTGINLPNGNGIIRSTKGIVGIYQVLHNISDVGEGFSVNWLCNHNNEKPKAMFKLSENYTCTGEIQFFDISQNPTTEWFWEFGDGNTSIEQNPSHIYTQNGLFTVKLKVKNSFGQDSISINEVILVQRPAAPQTFSAQRCGTGNLTLKAASTFGGKLKWYETEIGGNEIEEGDSLVLENLDSSKTFFVAETPSPLHVGPRTNTFGEGIYCTEGISGIGFIVKENCTLKSVKVYAQNSGYRSLYIFDINTQTPIWNNSVDLPTGESRVNINFPLEKGTYGLIVYEPNSGLYMNTSNVQFPYEINNLIALGVGLINGQGYLDVYPCFYDFEVAPKECKSIRSKATATIDKIPTIDFSYQIHKDSVFFENQSQNIENFLWYFGDKTSSGSENPTHVYLESDLYAVTLTGENRCGMAEKTEQIDLRGQATTLPATDIASNAAVLNGKVTAKGFSASVIFEFSKDTTESWTSVVANPVSLNDTGNFHVSREITDLKPNSKYYFRVKLLQGKRVFDGEIQEFSTTTERLPVAKTEAATNIGLTNAILNASINSNGLPTNFAFEYGLTENLGYQTQWSDTFTSNDFVEKTAILSGLAPNTTFYFRIKAMNKDGIVVGENKTFKTESFVAVTKSALNISNVSATLNGMVNTKGMLTKIMFEFGTTTQYGDSVDAIPNISVDSSDVQVSANLTQLSPNTLYHYRIKAVDAAGNVVFGADSTFKTLLTGIETFGMQILTLSPNPNNGVFCLTLHGNPCEIVTIRIISETGKTIFEKRIGNQSGEYHETIDISNVATGIYTILVQSKTLRETKKMIIQK